MNMEAKMASPFPDQPIRTIPIPHSELRVDVLDEKGAGGAHHIYSIRGPGMMQVVVPFQNGPIKEHGTNGVTQEALLAILIDRLGCFQSGPFPSPFNDSALHYLTLALHHLNHRTMDRLARNVEGTTQA